MWSMPRNLRKIAVIAIALMALVGLVSGVLGARDVAYLPGDAPSAPAAATPAIVAPEVTPLPTDLPPPPEPEPEPEPDPVVHLVELGELMDLDARIRHGLADMAVLVDDWISAHPVPPVK